MLKHQNHVHFTCRGHHCPNTFWKFQFSYSLLLVYVYFSVKLEHTMELEILEESFLNLSSVFCPVKTYVIMLVCISNCVLLFIYWPSKVLDLKIKFVAEASNVIIVSWTYCWLFKFIKFPLNWLWWMSFNVLNLPCIGCLIS